MEYLSFTIENYKAITNKVDINLKNKLIPIIGINECGKTTILQAIYAFDSNNDNLFNKTHITNIKNIKPILDSYIDYSQSNLHTDESTLYSGYKNRNIVTHNKGEYVKGNIYTNSIEGVFSLFKRRIYGIHHQISAKHLQKYINSFIFRYNNRKESDFDRLELALKSMFGKKLQYSGLVGKVV